MSTANVLEIFSHTFADVLLLILKIKFKNSYLENPNEQTSSSLLFICGTVLVCVCVILLITKVGYLSHYCSIQLAVTLLGVHRHSLID